jgi:hypothetical protein
MSNINITNPGEAADHPCRLLTTSKGRSAPPRAFFSRFAGETVEPNLTNSKSITSMNPFHGSTQTVIR